MALMQASTLWGVFVGRARAGAALVSLPACLLGTNTTNTGPLPLTTSNITLSVSAPAFR